MQIGTRSIARTHPDPWMRPLPRTHAVAGPNSPGAANTYHGSRAAPLLPSCRRGQGAPTARWWWWRRRRRRGDEGKKGPRAPATAASREARAATLWCGGGGERERGEREKWDEALR